MNFFLITGLVFTILPFLLICGFAFFIFLSFIRDDDDAKNVTRVAFGTMAFGLLILAWHFITRAF